MPIDRRGVWIDQGRAVVVTFGGGRPPRTIEIASDVPGRSKGRGGMRVGGGRVDGASHKKHERKRAGLLDRFYEEVAASLEGADRIAVIGPGEARKHLVKKLEEERHPGGVVAVLPADDLTDGQIVARLKDILGAD